MSDYIKREKIINIKNKCRGRFRYTSIDEIYEACQRCNGCNQKNPFEYVYYVPEKGGYISETKYDKTPNCIIVLSFNEDYDSDGNPYHTCLCEKDRWFIKLFKNNKLEITRNEEDAYQFFSDDDVDECMERLISDKHPWTISIWEFTGNKPICECVHYPNEHWCVNRYIQPSLMNKTVDEWLKEHSRDEKFI